MYTDVEVNITVSDVNDGTPIFEQDSYTGSVTEHEAAGTSVLVVRASDTVSS